MAVWLTFTLYDACSLAAKLGVFLAFAAATSKHFSPMDDSVVDAYIAACQSGNLSEAEQWFARAPDACARVFSRAYSWAHPHVAKFVFRNAAYETPCEIQMFCEPVVIYSDEAGLARYLDSPFVRVENVWRQIVVSERVDLAVFMVNERKHPIPCTLENFEMALVHGKDGIFCMFFESRDFVPHVADMVALAAGKASTSRLQHLCNAVVNAGITKEKMFAKLTPRVLSSDNFAYLDDTFDSFSADYPAWMQATWMHSGGPHAVKTTRRLLSKGVPLVGDAWRCVSRSEHDLTVLALKSGLADRRECYTSQSWLLDLLGDMQILRGTGFSPNSFCKLPKDLREQIRTVLICMRRVTLPVGTGHGPMPSAILQYMFESILMAYSLHLHFAPLNACGDPTRCGTCKGWQHVCCATCRAWFCKNCMAK